MTISMYKKERIDKIVDLISNVADLFYQDKIHEGYDNLEKLLGELSLTVEILYQEGILSAEDTSILDILKEIMSAMEQKDTLLIADMLEYELKDTLLQLVA